jgi:hypothetical protein
VKICECGTRAHARGMCRPCYRRWWRSQERTPAPPRPEAADKVAYLSVLTEGELAAYCAGVLSHASAVASDRDEVQRWTELVRLTSDRLEGAR